MRRAVRWLICLVALAAIPLVLRLTAPVEQPHPWDRMTPAAREFARGADCLDVDLNAPMDVETAVEHFDRAIELADNAKPATKNDASIAERAAFLKAWARWAHPSPDFDAAGADLDGFIARHPDSALLPQAFFLLGLIDGYRPFDTDAARAAESFRRVVELAPTSGLADFARLQLANLYRAELLDFAEAARWYDEAVSRAGATYQPEERASFRYMQARMLREAGDTARAVRVYRSILAGDLDTAGDWTERVLDRLEDLGARTDDDLNVAASAASTSVTMTSHRFTPATPVTISVSFWILSKKGMSDGIAEIRRRYEERTPGVTIKIVDLPFGGYHDWLQSQILGREIPDIVQIDNGTAIRYGAEQGRLVDLTASLAAVNPYTGRVWAEMYWPQFITAARDPVGRRNWDVSWASENNGFFYNKDAFRKAGIVRRGPDGALLLGDDGKPVVDEPRVWSDLLEAYRKLQTIGVYGEVCEFFPDPAPIIWETPYITKQIYHDLMSRLDVITPDGYPDPFEVAKGMIDGSLDLRDPQVAELWRLLYEKSEYWVPGSTSMDLQQTFSDFASGRAATLFWVSSELPDFEKACPFEIGVFPFPSLEGTPFFDGFYTETPSLRAFEFAVPKATETRGTRDAAIDFLQYFTSPEAQRLLVENGNVLSPIRGIGASKRLEPFMRWLNRPDGRLLTFSPYEIGIIKEPYWAEGRARVINELNTLLGDIPNFEYYRNVEGGSREEYERWRERRFAKFLDNLQTYFKWAYERVVEGYSEDRHLELARARKRWFKALRAHWDESREARDGTQAPFDDALAAQWRAIVDHIAVIDVCESMMPPAAKADRYRPPALSHAAQRRIGRAVVVGLTMLLAGWVLFLNRKGTLDRFLKDWRHVKWLAPTIVLLGLFSYFPAGSAIYHAFFRWNGSDVSEFIGLKNFIDAARDGVLGQSFVLMLVFLVANIVKLIPTVLVAVILFHVANRRAQYWFRVVFVIPLIFPSMVTILIWKYFYKMDGGVLNALLLRLDLIHAPVNWLGSEQTVIPALLFIGFPFVSTIGVLILLAGLQSISESVFEAAEIDGCGPLRRFSHIELPLIMGQIKLNLVLLTIGTVQDFALPLILTRGGPNNASMLPGLWMYLNAFSYGRMGYAAAIGVVMFLIIIGFTYVNLRYLNAEKED